MGNTGYRPLSDQDTEISTSKEGKTKQRSSKNKSKKAGSNKENGKNQKGFVNEKSSRKNVKDKIAIKKAVFVLSKKTKFTDDYELKETLGEGAFGVVGKGKNKDSGAIRAVKMLSKKKLTKEELSDIANEIEIIKDLDHPNIVKIFEEYEDHKYLYIVTELIEGGELFDELIRKK